MKTKLAPMLMVAGLTVAILLSAQRIFSDTFTFTGPDLCKMCHKSKDNSGAAWDASKHAQALKTLSSEEAKKHSDNPAADEKCLACHTTGYGAEGGYKIGGDNAKLENVSCEACHGAGSGYKTSMTKYPDAYDKGLIVPSVAVCVRCHNAKSPTFKEFHFQEACAAIRHGKEEAMKTPPVQAAYTGMKACAMCHKNLDTSVTAYQGSKHAVALDALKTDEAKKYSEDPLNDTFCLSCHTTGLTDAGGYDPAAEEDVRAKLAGVQCEACHGPGEKYKKTMKSHDESVAGGLMVPSEKTCRKCHNALSPTFKAFNYDEALKAVAHGKK